MIFGLPVIVTDPSTIFSVPRLTVARLPTTSVPPLTETGPSMISCPLRTVHGKKTSQLTMFWTRRLSDARLQMIYVVPVKWTGLLTTYVIRRLTAHLTICYADQLYHQGVMTGDWAVLPSYDDLL